MIKNITLGQYFPGESAIHKLDARIKIVIAILLLVTVFAIQTVWGFVVLAALYLGIMVVAKIKPIVVLRSLRPLLFIIIFTFILNIFFFRGGEEDTVLVQWGAVTITKMGVEKAIFIAIRLVLLIVSTTLLSLTTSPMQLTDGMESLMSPLKKTKFPVHEIAMMMSIAMRFIPTLSEETERIMKAQTARGAEFDSGNLLKKAKNMIPLLVPLFVSAFKRADELALAMESRCYRGGGGRTRMKILRTNRTDWVALILMCVICVGLMIWL